MFSIKKPFYPDSGVYQSIRKPEQDVNPVKHPDSHDPALGALEDQFQSDNNNILSSGTFLPIMNSRGGMRGGIKDEML